MDLPVEIRKKLLLNVEFLEGCSLLPVMRPMPEKDRQFLRCKTTRDLCKSNKCDGTFDLIKDYVTICITQTIISDYQTNKSEVNKENDLKINTEKVDNKHNIKIDIIGPNPDFLNLSENQNIDTSNNLLDEIKDKTLKKITKTTTKKLITITGKIIQKSLPILGKSIIKSSGVIAGVFESTEIDSNKTADKPPGWEERYRRLDHKNENLR